MKAYWEQERNECRDYIQSFKVVVNNKTKYSGLTRKKAVKIVNELNDTEILHTGSNLSGH